MIPIWLLDRWQRNAFDTSVAASALKNKCGIDVRDIDHFVVKAASVDSSIVDARKIEDGFKSITTAVIQCEFTAVIQCEFVDKSNLCFFLKPLLLALGSAFYSLDSLNECALEEWAIALGIHDEISKSRLIEPHDGCRNGCCKDCFDEFLISDQGVTTLLKKSKFPRWFTRRLTVWFHAFMLAHASRHFVNHIDVDGDSFVRQRLQSLLKAVDREHRHSVGRENNDKQPEPAEMLTERPVIF